ncbi:MAG: hypothetical protein P8163_18215, partial [Candidatus Thiodiazotropha sp.]
MNNFNNINNSNFNLIGDKGAFSHSAPFSTQMISPAGVDTLRWTMSSSAERLSIMEELAGPGMHTFSNATGFTNEVLMKGISAFETLFEGSSPLASLSMIMGLSSSAATTLLGGAMNAQMNLYQGMVDAYQDVLGGVKNSAEVLIEGQVDAAKTMIGTLDKAGSEYVEGYLGAHKSLFEGLTGAVDEVVTGLKNSFGELMQGDLFGAGEALLQTVVGSHLEVLDGLMKAGDQLLKGNVKAFETLVK